MQRGVVQNYNTSAANTWEDVATISNIDPEKSLLIIDLHTMGGATNMLAFALTSNAIRVIGAGKATIFYASWQVIEFY